MEQCFRIAFWMMFLLTGYLQAQPVPGCNIKTGDLGLGLLKKLSCSGTMNFISPVMGNEENEECYVAALGLLRKGLQDAEKICTDNYEYINSTLDALEQPPCLNMKTTECNFTMKVHEQFGQFVKETEDFFKQWNSVRLWNLQ